MKDLIPPAVRRRIERKAIAASPEASEQSVILHWEQRYSAFVLLVAHDNVSWKNGYTATAIAANEAVKLELFIGEKTAPIIEKLAATVRPARLISRKQSVKSAAPAVNPIIGDLDGTFKYGTWPNGMAAAVITNDLKAAVNSTAPGVTWEEIQDAVRFVHTHIPTGKVRQWQKSLGRGGAS